MKFQGICIRILFILPLLFSVKGILYAQDIEELIKSSKEYSDKGAYQQAMNLINRAISYDSLRADVFLQRATISYYLGNYDNTIKDCYAALRFKTDLPDVYLLRGKVCMVTESYGGAILFFGKAMKFSTDQKLLFEVYLNRGQAYYNLNRFQDALVDFQAAYAIDDTSKELLLALSDTYLRLKKPVEALTTLNKAIASNPDYAPLYEMLGRIAVENNNFPQAIQAYEKYTSLNVTSPSAFNELADIYRIDKQYEKALNALNRSLSLDPLEPQSHKVKGMVYLDMGETEIGCNTLFRSMQLGYLEKYGYDLLDIYLSNCEK
jgi:tetratricopeptide (TPR) repeat protein